MSGLPSAHRTGRATAVSILTCVLLLLCISHWAQAAPNDPGEGGAWSSVQGWPMIPVSAANLPDGRIVAWASNERTAFPAGPEFTYTAIWDPQTNSFTEVPHPSHDMFCSHHVVLEDGKVFVSGGRNQGNSPWTSVFNPETDTWDVLPDMKRGRWYPTSVMTGDGKVLTAIGSGGGNTAEIWDGSNWTLMGGLNFDAPILNYTHGERNWWPILHLAPDGRIFHSGPTPAMHMIDPNGTGSITQTNTHTDWYPKHGTTVMYEQGKLLTAGGWTGANALASSARSMTIDLNGPSPVITEIAPMQHARKFHNGVTLPNGEVLVVGGNTSGAKFNDTGTVFPVEIWNPVSGAWREGASMSVPRNYHSIALLMLDGRVLSGGGGLCNCAADHQDSQIYSPPYLFNADGSAASRPIITRVPGVVEAAATVSVTATPGLSGFSIVKMSSTTHAMNTDLRYLRLTSSETSAGEYSLPLPTNPNVLTPGYWMLFALNAQGTPSVAKVIQVSTQGTRIGPPSIKQMGNMTSLQGAPTSLALVISDPDGDAVSASATGLPPGLILNPSSGVISGSATTAGTYNVAISVNDNSDGSDSTAFVWQIEATGGGVGSGRYVRFVALSEINGKPWSSAAEINLLDESGAAYNRAAWSTSADSEEFNGENGAVGNAFDGNAASIWHTEWAANAGDDLDPAHPHQVIIDMGLSQPVSGLRYLPRAGGGNGTIAQYAAYLSDDPTNWGAPVAQGVFVAGATEKEVLFSGTPPGGNTAPTLVNPGNQGSLLGDSVNLLIDADDADGQTLVFTATDLPTGLSINAATGLISGTTNAVGTHTTTIIVDDGTDTATASFSWVVNSNNIAPTLNSISNQAGVVGDNINLTLEAADANGDPLTFNAAGLPGGVSINSSNGQISGMLTHSGSYQPTVTVSDGALTASRTFNWIVADVNDPPTLAAIANQSGEVGVGVSLALAASDPNSDPLTYSASGLPPGLSVHASTGVISGSPTTAGSYNVNAAVSDGALTANQSFSWSITAAAEPIVIAPLAMPPQQTGGVVSYSASATGTGPLEYRWSFADGSPSGSFDSSPEHSHTFSAPGRYLVTLDVRNAVETQSLTFTQAVHAPHTTLPARASSTIISDSSTGVERIWNVNPDNDSVSVIAAGSGALLAEIPVGEKPMALASNGNGQVWVSNQLSDSVSRINATTLAVVGTISLPLGSAPFGIVIDQSTGTAYIGTEGLEQVLVRDGSSGNATGQINVGGNVRHLSLAGDGATLFATRFITPLLPGESTANVQTSAGGVAVGGELLVIDAASRAITNTITLAHSEAVISEHSGPGLPNYLRAAAISPDGMTTYVPGKQDNVLTGALRNAGLLDHDHTVRAISSRVDLNTGLAPLTQRIDHDNASVAAAAAFDASGSYLFVALEGNRMVAAVDAYRGEELFRFFSGRAPTGLIMGADGTTLYVHNFMDRSITRHDLSVLINTGDNAQMPLGSVAVVNSESLAPQVLLGKQHFYDAMDPRLTLESYMSCASCHNEGDSDGRVWDFTQFGEGLRNTSALLGQGGSDRGPVHWSGNFDEIQDFEGQIRSFARGLGLMSDADFNAGSRSLPLGTPKAGLSPDLDALTAYVNSLTTVGSSPARPTAGTHSAEAQAGQALFVSEGCNSCHTGDHFSDSALDVRHDVGSLTTASGQRLGQPLDGLDTPTLKGLWRTAPYLHDGSAATIGQAIDAHSSVTLSAAQTAQLSAYIAEIDDASGQTTGGGCTDCVDFDAVATVSYSNQDFESNVTISAAGSTIELRDNTWRRTDFLFEVTANTVLEFDLHIDSTGEIHGIGFDNDNSINSNRTFKLHGTQNWGLPDFNTHSGNGTEHFVIPVGRFYTGSNLALFLVNDNDAGSGNNSVFSNVRLYEAQCSDCLDFATLPTESYGNQDQASDITVEDGGNAVQLNDNTWRRTLQTFNITANSVLEFQFSSDQEGEIHGIGFDVDNGLSSNRIFKVHGSQGWGIRAFDNYSGSGSTTYRIPVGDYYTGSGMHLVLVNDRDSGTGINSRFSNVRLIQE